MNNDALLRRAVAIIVFLFAAFSSFLKDIAPPDDTGAAYAVGIASMCTLFPLLIISAFARAEESGRNKARWLTAGAIFVVTAIVVGVLYVIFLHMLTYRDEEGSHVKGWELTVKAREFVIRNPGILPHPDKLVRNFPKEEPPWTKDSIWSSSIILTTTYTAVAVSIAAAVFSFLEANARPKPQIEHRAIRKPSSPRNPRRRGS